MSRPAKKSSHAAPPPPVRQRSWRAVLGPELQSTGLVVVFGSTRSQIAKVSLTVAGKPIASLPTKPGAQRLLRFQWPGGTPQGELVLTAGYRGDVPQIAVLIWISEEADTDAEPVMLLPDGFAVTEDVPVAFEYLVLREERRRGTFAMIASSTEADEIIDPAMLAASALFAQRSEVVLRDCMVRRFWYELDRQTLVDLGTESWKEAVASVTYLLFEQLERRAQIGAATGTPKFGKLADVGQTIVLGHLTSVSTLFKSLVDLHLTLPDGSSLFEWAFVQFAAGAAGPWHHDPVQHALLETHGVPNGSEFFKFGELALACIENELEPAFWKEHLAAFVLATHLFLENTDAPPAGLAQLGAENGYGYQRNRPFPLARRKELIDEYALLLAGTTAEERLAILRDRYTSIVAQAFPDTVNKNHNVASDPLVHAAVIARQLPAPPSYPPPIPGT